MAEGGSLIEAASPNERGIGRPNYRIPLEENTLREVFYEGGQRAATREVRTRRPGWTRVRGRAESAA